MSKKQSSHKLKKPSNSILENENEEQIEESLQNNNSIFGPTNLFNIENNGGIFGPNESNSVITTDLTDSNDVESSSSSNSEQTEKKHKRVNIFGETIE